MIKCLSATNCGFLIKPSKSSGAGLKNHIFGLSGGIPGTVYLIIVNLSFPINPLTTSNRPGSASASSVAGAIPGSHDGGRILSRLRTEGTYGVRLAILVFRVGETTLNPLMSARAPGL